MRLSSLSAAAVLFSFTLAFFPPTARAAEAPLRLRIATDDDVFIPALAQQLGYFADAGIVMVPVKVEDFSKDDYLMQAPWSTTRWTPACIGSSTRSSAPATTFRSPRSCSSMTRPA